MSGEEKNVQYSMLNRQCSILKKRNRIVVVQVCAETNLPIGRQVQCNWQQVVNRIQKLALNNFNRSSYNSLVACSS